MSISSRTVTLLSHVVIGLMIDALDGRVTVDVIIYVTVPRSN
jgi:hypothetical protein